MLIVDRDLRQLVQERHLVVQSSDPKLPFDPNKQIGPGSIDLRLDNKFLRFRQSVETIDLSVSGDTESLMIPDGEDLIIRPRELMLGTTLENVVLPANIAGFISSRSSIARLGLVVVTQTFIQPGHAQKIALQLVNVTDRPIRVRPFLAVCQIMLTYTTSPSAVPYGSNPNSKYRDEVTGPEPSKIGVELGLDRTEDISAADSQHKRDTVESVTKLREEINVAPMGGVSINQSGSKMLGILALVFLILGSSVSEIISQLDARPFPSIKLVVGVAFAVFCVSILAVAYWRK